ncbi:GntR family transcriptional regulator [Brevundimonas sp. PAMC22021]|uniref:GntR family transcriptional regulator n=1 Tax=Brevundimonas sp. PAMC22021 TaxID=2861285 RepID=UPI001C62CE57|nr:GntR family transcriptional regulator [Brevundimonas sp. PAMC22021]QYF87063.1 GntR family transcriptional regulator [Brevundimonas sp. PAMC22021]
MHSVQPRDPYGAALGAVRRLAEAGRFVPGEPIVVTDLAAEVGFSPTPVREALACLAGQGLIERRRGRGYFYPALTASEVIDLFELQLAYLHAALTLHPRGLAPLRKAVMSVDPLNGVQTLFDAIITQSANAALALAHQRLVDRLGAVLKAEKGNDYGDGATVQAMVRVINKGDIPALLDLLEDHHERRCARASMLLIQTA